MVTKARQLAEFIANADVDSDEIATGAVSASKLADTLDLSSKTIVMPDVAAFNITSGDVGIGTSSPVSELNVDGRIVVDDGARSNPSGGPSVVIDYQTTSDVQGRIRSRDWDGATWKNFTIEANNINLIPAGNVGVGTTSPTESLDIAGGSIRIGNSKIRHSGSGGSWDMAFETYSGGYFERMRIDSVGNVGVGTTSPDIYSFGGKILSVNGGTSYTNLVLAGDTNTGIAFGTSSARLGQISMDSTNGLTLYSQGTGNGQTMTLDRSGNVGIGTTNPSTKLHVKTTTIAAGSDLDEIAIIADTPFVSGYQSQSASLLSGFDSTIHGTAIGMVYENPGYALTFFTNNSTSGLPTERLRINDSGNVGINRGVNLDSTVTIEQLTDGTDGGIRIYGSNSNSIRGQMYYDGTQSFVIHGTSGPSGEFSTLRFATGTYNNPQIRMSINKDNGNVGIGTTSPGRKLDINGPDIVSVRIRSGNQSAYAGMEFTDEISSLSQIGYIRHTHSDTNTATHTGQSGNAAFLIGTTENDTVIGFNSNMSSSSAGTNRGSIKFTSSGTTYNTTSDLRLKENIKPISDGKEKLLAMKPKTFNFIEDENKVKMHGFIAQEMKDIIPEAVSNTKDPELMMSMDYGRITPVIVAALQDALKEIEQLKTRINELEVK